ncbi:MAG: zinc ribbon domain-containing protein, partial [Chloroflexi bacterium]
MPVYGYRCSRGHHFEVQQRITEAPLSQCPECGAPVTRVFYPVG